MKEELIERLEKLTFKEKIRLLLEEAEKSGIYMPKISEMYDQAIIEQLHGDIYLYLPNGYIVEYLKSGTVRISHVLLRFTPIP